MEPEQGRELMDLIFEHRFQNILELGFRHGTSTCYMAAALDQLGDGAVTTIDLESAKDADPNIEDLLKRLGLRSYVSVYYEPTSYIWRLMKMLDQEEPPQFDFCYIDGAHDWFTDGFAFFLVDRLLQPGGLIIFDDLDWTFIQSRALRKTEMVRQMPEEERTTPQVRRIYELLVKPHPSYHRFVEKEDWAYAWKADSDRSVESEIKTEKVYETKHTGLGALLIKIGKKLRRGLRK